MFFFLTAPASSISSLLLLRILSSLEISNFAGSRPIGEPSASPPGVSRVAAQFKDIPGATSGQSRESIEIAGYGTTTYTAYDEAVAAKACEWLRERAAGDDDRPFAAVTGFVLPHCPFFAPKELFDYFHNVLNMKWAGIRKPRSYSNVQLSNASGWMLAADTNVGAGGNNC
eukprot:COSAG04_NODE_2881_length_3429_cov_1.251952_1_plen_170_part_10